MGEKKKGKKKSSDEAKVGIEYIRSQIEKFGGWRALWYSLMEGTSLKRGTGGMKWHFFPAGKGQPYPLLRFYERMGPGRVISLVFKHGLDKPPSINLYDWRKTAKGEFIHGIAPVRFLSKSFVDEALRKLIVKRPYRYSHFTVTHPNFTGPQFAQFFSETKGKWIKYHIPTRQILGEKSTPYKNVPKDIPGSKIPQYVQYYNKSKGVWVKIHVHTRTKVGESKTKYPNIPVFRR